MALETVIGLEIHVELNTASKMFCGCPVTFGEPPNTAVCPVCLGHPGVLPVINKRAVESAAMIGLSLNCAIAPLNQFARKNYFYPDMPKDYQISQFDLPIAVGGYLDVGDGGGTRRIGITRVHMEEDTGKLIHKGQSGRIHGADYSIVDFNRAGVPLMEIVSEPDMRSSEEARAFMVKLRSILLALGISDCNMEEGSLRCDANVSLREFGEAGLGVKTEVKNMNSFRALRKALEYEIARQTKMIAAGDRIIQETRHWDDAGGVTISLRSKEEAHDYRYFPDPDLVNILMNEDEVAKLKAALPELPDARAERLARDFSLETDEAKVLALNKPLGDFFEEAVAGGSDAKKAVNWLLHEVSAALNQTDAEIDETAFTPRHLVDLLKLLDKGTISGKMAKDIFKESFETGKLPSVIVEEKGHVQITDEDALTKIIDQVIAENPKAVEDFRGGQARAVGFLVGNVMRLTQGKASPDLVNKILKERLA
ncbi:MAG: Asp-tRNA(Asn)/Glu-tRNA(Gln) amidotransferase subunit GatB [Actinomycetota bacterium]